MTLFSNSIIDSFINCPYKAYLKQKQQNGIISDYEKLYDRLRQTQIEKFTNLLSQKSKIGFRDTLFSEIVKKDGLGLNVTFENENVNIILDGIELIHKKNFVPVFITTSNWIENIIFVA